jgi:2-haloacid dehalogenase
MAARWATFDCFGTLIDWRHGIRTSAELVFPGHGDRLLEAYNRHESRVQAEHPTMRYRRVMAEALRRAAIDEGLEPTDDDTAVLGDTIGYWPVFPDVRAALEELRADGRRLALLTNCDRDLIGLSQRRMGVPIDAVVTAEDVGCYKPAHRHFERFAEAYEVSHDRWVHVAQSHFHDMVPAADLGIPRVWINRTEESADASVAGAVLPDLTGLAAAVNQVATG